MSDAEARRKESDLLGQAINQYIKPEGVLGDWMVIACSTQVDDEGEPMAQYHIGFSGGSMLDHHALGLLDRGRWMLEDGEARENGAA